MMARLDQEQIDSLDWISGIFLSDGGGVCRPAGRCGPGETGS